VRVTGFVKSGLPLFFAWHLVAITVGNIKAPPLLRTQPRPASASWITRRLDEAAAALGRVHALVWEGTALVRPATDAYLQLTGQVQPWNMFSNPARFDEYLRVRYYIGRDRARPAWMATELVMPTGREDRVRLAGAYRDSYEDKAYAVALERFYQKRPARLIAPHTSSKDLPADLAPVARYHARRFAASALGAGERILRVEVWHGVAPTPEPGRSGNERGRLARTTALLEYYEGPVEVRFNVPLIPPYHAVDHDGDLEWLLEYFEES
jgi:hypothetical protein